jgi:hypothetical protein
MKSLESICIGIQISIRALYTQLQTIYLYVALSKLNDIAIYQIVSRIKSKDATCPLIRCGGIS